MPGIGARLQRLAGRHMPAEIRDRTHSFSGPDFRWCWRAAWAARDPTTRFRLDSQRSLELGRSAARAGFGEATHLYAMLTEFLPLIIAAKEQVCRLSRRFTFSLAQNASWRKNAVAFQIGSPHHLIGTLCVGNFFLKTYSSPERINTSAHPNPCVTIWFGIGVSRRAERRRFPMGSISNG